MYTSRVSGHVDAPRAAVYRALVSAEAIARWRVPTGMRAEVHEFDAREGGRFRVSLTYEAPDVSGKSAAHTDTYHGHFARLAPDEQVVEVLEFETADPARGGAMTLNLIWPRPEIYNSVPPFEWYLQWGGVLFVAAVIVTGVLMYRLKLRHRTGVLAGHAAPVVATAPSAESARPEAPVSNQLV